MKTKKFFALAGLLFFIVSVLFLVSGQGYAINPQPEPPGDKTKSVIRVNESYMATIIKIEGNQITVRDGKGIEKVITGSVSGLKVGDKIRVTTKDGRTWLNPQPEPPAPLKTKPPAK